MPERVPRVRFTIRRMMAAVALLAAISAAARWSYPAIDGWLRPKGVYYRGIYRAPDGRVVRGTIIYVRRDGSIFVD